MILKYCDYCLLIRICLFKVEKLFQSYIDWNKTLEKVYPSNYFPA